jgi:hypothetical protein
MARKPLSGFGIVTEVDKHLTADKVTVTLRVFNETRQDIKLDFQYWPVHDVVIRDKEGKEIWRESHGRFYTQDVSTATIPPSITVKKGKPHIFECTWNLTDNDKKRVGSGKYTVEGVVNSTPCAMKANTIVEVGFKALDKK